MVHRILRVMRVWESLGGRCVSKASLKNGHLGCVWKVGGKRQGSGRRGWILYIIYSHVRTWQVQTFKHEGHKDWGEGKWGGSREPDPCGSHKPHYRFGTLYLAFSSLFFVKQNYLYCWKYYRTSIFPHCPLHPTPAPHQAFTALLSVSMGYAYKFFG